MADTMIERVAIAIAADYGWIWADLPDKILVANTEHDKALYLSMARAALAAMREPTEAMVDAMSRAVDPDQYNPAVECVWQCAIDCALSGERAVDRIEVKW